MHKKPSRTPKPVSKTDPRIPSNQTLTEARERLLCWFESHGREFPWRKTSITNYQYVIAEVLLQRTRAEVVARVFLNFIKEFPSWKRLESATGVAGQMEYLEIDNKENAIDSLLRAEEHISKAEKCAGPVQGDGTCRSAFHWKWVIICLQNSLYTFALTAAAGTNPGNVQRRKGGVVDLVTALKLCIEVKHFYYSLPVEFTRNQKNSMLWLHSHFRNGFEHFRPNNIWGIDLRGMPNICIDVLDVIKLLALDSRNISYGSTAYSRREKERKIKACINMSVEILRSSALYEPENEVAEFPDLDKWWGSSS